MSPPQPQITPRESRVRNAPGTWHNPSGDSLRAVCRDVWVIERGYVDRGVDVGAKCTIIRIPDRRLFVHSALPLDDGLKQAVDELGTVSAVVAGNSQHVDFVACWKSYYPNATCLAPPGLMARRPDVPFDAELSVDGTAHAAYGDADGTIRQVYLGACGVMGETVFFHVPSKTLVVTDLVFTFPEKGLPFGTRFAKWFLRYAFTPVLYVFFVKDKKAYESALEEIEGLGFERIIACHGQIVAEGAVDVFKAWHGH